MAGHRIIVTGGGTGGHIYPALAVYERLKDDPEVEDILYIGALGHMEERLAAEKKINFVGLNSFGMPRRLSMELLTWPVKMLAALGEAKLAVRKFRPTAMLGTGGYASAPPLAAALSQFVPYIIHEPDAFPGLVNRTFARWAAMCSLGMEGARHRIGCEDEAIVVNGNPIASSFSQAPSRAAASAEFGLKPGLRTLLITGGSQGAQAINEAVCAALPELLTIDPPIQIIHQVGDKNFADYKASAEKASGHSNRYVIRPYLNNIAVAYAASDLSLCRSGAMTIAELGLTGTPAIFVPYPFASKDHQTSNARFIESKNAALVIPQNELTPASLVEAVRGILSDTLRFTSMKNAMSALAKPNAAIDIAQQLKQISTDYQNERKGR